jgi:hypothetical protein
VGLFRRAPARDFSGTLVGTVTDTNEGRIPGADNLLRSASSGIERQAVTNNGGEFRFNDLPPASFQFVQSQ